uniref:Uncharacterized protein n=1 Tax=Arundo donax TaxID=35708 RepID=A0A0A8ZIZ3_ARUDO
MHLNRCCLNVFEIKCIT